MKLFSKKLNINSIFIWMISSILLNFFIESIWRGGISYGFDFLINSFLVFLFNAMIIMFSTSIIFLVKRRIFTFTLISTIWLLLSIANRVVIVFRGSPLTGNDLTLIRSGLLIADNYLSQSDFLLISFSIFIVILLLVILWVFAPKHKNKISYIKNSLGLVIIMLILFISNSIALKTNIVSTNFWNIYYSYRDYGFPYAFSTTTLNNGIKKPSNYSKNLVETLTNSYSDNLIALNTFNSSNNTNFDNYYNTNIIMVQLESFFDPTLINGLVFSEDPIPNFKRLSKEYSSGSLSVSSIGGGTANTEFEVITGMNLDFFSPGEYPYNTILRTTAVESANTLLKEHNYTTHALHNHQGGFYNRNIVFSNLGFDTYTSVEYMDILGKTPLNWAKDDMLINPIIDCLISSEGADFIYTISVQGHGNYPDYKVYSEPKITVTGSYDEGTLNSIEYYTAQINEMDQFIQALIDSISELDEKSIIVFYGDHQPNFNLSESDLSTNNLYSTEYFIWDNIGFEKEDLNLETYQLLSSIFKKIQIENGVINNYHINHINNEDYLSNLKVLQYDILYGKKYSYDSINLFTSSDLKMGVKDIIINDIIEYQSDIYIYGENFTSFSKVLLNSNIVSTEFIDSSTLKISNVDLKSSNSISVAQIGDDNTVLSSTSDYLYKK